MLPVLDPKKISTSILLKKKDKYVDVKAEQDSPSDEGSNPELESACEDVLMAIDQKSVKDLAKALQAAFAVCDSMPHEEGEHLEEED
jgi:hypothetical protein